MINSLPQTIEKKSKKVGRGYGTGKGGHTIGKGMKGHKSRSGYKNPRPGFEGGQMPLSRRIPKLKGFTRGYLKINESVKAIILGDLNIFNDGDTVDTKALKEKKLISYKVKVAKIINKGELTKKINVSGLLLTKSVNEIIVKMGGTIK
jgi:large subunit ribosomal protein L15